MALRSDLQLRQLLADPDLGAGNFISRIAQEEFSAGQTISLDEPARLPDGAETQELSLKQLLDNAELLARWYAGQGVDAKDPVALYFDDSVDYLIHYVALTRMGALPVFINGGMDESIAVDFIHHVAPMFVMTDTTRRQQLRKAGLRIVDFDATACDFYRGGSNYRVFTHGPNDPVLVAHSSGTTGRPKAVRFNHAGFFYGVRQEINRQVGERVLSALPQSHASALSILMTVLVRGACILLQTRQNPLGILESIERFRPDLFCSFPKIYVDLCRLDLERWDLSSIAYWLSTGDANHEPHIRQLMTYGNHPDSDRTVIPGSLFIDNLGSSELGFAAFRNVHRPGDSPERYGRRIGHPFDWVEAAILDETGTTLPAFRVGQLGVRAESVTAGYWNDSLRSEKNRLAGYWLTGDLAYVDDDGVFFHLDRTSDCVITREGVLYSCQAEELVLKHLPEIFDCSVVGVEGHRGGIHATIAVEMRDSRDEVQAEEMLTEINRVMAEKALPRITFLTFESALLDLGVTGKKLKRVLRERLAEAQDQGAEPQA